ncbi:MAG: DMT family transporter [Anaerolineae bacterium]|nr:DMT family transporter [Anaerolineae bacterium]
MQRTYIAPTFQALLAAVLFGASAPLAKVLLGQVEPVFLASFLYLGSGFGVLLFRIAAALRSPGQAQEARLSRSDFRWLTGAVAAGGVLAPILLLFSLRETPASTASLLLNFEGVATAFIAAVVFKEAMSRRALWAILAVTLGSILLSWDASGDWGISLGALGVVGACALWGIDNNLTRNIAAKDPLTIVLVKGLGAGTVSFILALLLGNRLPALPVILGAMILGSLSYGLSIALFIRAMRGLGAARTSAVFGTAPLAGVALSFAMFQETVTLSFAGALLLMMAAMAMLLTEQHGHRHRHEAITHDHRHRHDDDHHNHDHPGMTDRSLSHAHAHAHETLEHEHPHLPDIHHRHAHASE